MPRATSPHAKTPRTVVSLVSSVLQKGPSGPSSSTQPSDSASARAQLASVLEANLDRRRVAGDLDNAHVLDVNAAGREVVALDRVEIEGARQKEGRLSG